MCLATVTFASSMNSSTSECVSSACFTSTSTGSCVSVPTENRTSGDASMRAPASIRLRLSFLASLFRVRRLSVKTVLSEASSIRIWASEYIMAALDLMTDLKNSTLTISASGVSSHTVETARRSSLPRSEQMFDDSTAGTMSIRRRVRYTVVLRLAASPSANESGRMKWVTSAMCTPTSTLPLGSGRACRASSMSVHPGGSTLQMFNSRKSRRFSSSAGGTVHGSAGISLSTASANGW
mmetsp:Transcript_20191/g.52375  ORF Transcript_20191/g.52375 Transcript_20191/m.52375 type:complete len:238 (-) Transcript_20191:436-1149(-)